MFIVVFYSLYIPLVLLIVTYSYLPLLSLLIVVIWIIVHCNLYHAWICFGRVNNIVLSLKGQQCDNRISFTMFCKLIQSFPQHCRQYSLQIMLSVARSTLGTARSASAARWKPFLHIASSKLTFVPRGLFYTSSLSSNQLDNKILWFIRWGSNTGWWIFWQSSTLPIISWMFSIWKQ